MEENIKDEAMKFLKKRNWSRKLDFQWDRDKAIMDNRNRELVTTNYVHYEKQK